MTLTLLELPFGFASLGLDAGVDQSAPGALIHSRVRTVRGRRVWSVRWDGWGLGAALYMRQIYLAGGQGADVLEWYPPNNGTASVAVRFTVLDINVRSAALFEISATLEEALEPC